MNLRPKSLQRLSSVALFCVILILCGGCWGGGLFSRRSESSATVEEEIAEQQSQNTSIEPRIYHLPYATVFEQSRRTLSDLDWQVTTSNESEGLQEAFPGLHFFSWGSKLRVKIESLEANRTRVQVIYGDNRGGDAEKVALFFGRLDTRIGSIQAEEAGSALVSAQRIPVASSTASTAVASTTTATPSQVIDVTARTEAFGEGNTLFAQGKYLEAAENFNRAFRIDPTFADAIYNAGTAYYYAGDYTLAENAYNFYVQLRPNDPEGYYYRGVCRYKQSNVDSAVADWKKVLELNNSHTAARANLEALGQL